jgi:electron transfer flavoprotein alpha subunit
MSEILVVAEHFNGKLIKSTLSAITFAKQVGDVNIAVIGSDISAVADELKVFGAKKIFKIESEKLENYMAHEYAEAVAGLAAHINAEYVVMTTSTNAKDLMPVVAMRLSAGMASDIIGYEDGKFKRSMYAGNAVATLEITTDIKVVTVLGTAFSKAEAAGEESPVEDFAAEISTGKAKWVAMDEVVSDRPELTEAGIIVSGGRGFKGPENKNLIDALADKLNAAVGWTRAAVDAGWATNDLQVGQTGKIVAPDLYVAIGLSGSIQHLAGMKNSKTIIAINKDEEAPIFSVADYGMVADLFNVLPELTEKINAQTEG